MSCPDLEELSMFSFAALQKLLLSLWIFSDVEDGIMCLLHSLRILMKTVLICNQNSLLYLIPIISINSGIDQIFKGSDFFFKAFDIGMQKMSIKRVRDDHQEAECNKQGY